MKLNWGNYIFIFILIFLSLCTIFIIFSLRQDIDLVTENYYEEGADYTSEMEIENRSKIFKDSITLLQKPDYLTLQLANSIAKNISSIDLWFYRPSDKDSDYRAELSLTGDSVTIDHKLLIKGRYILHVSWLRDNETYLIKKDVFIK